MRLTVTAFGVFFAIASVGASGPDKPASVSLADSVREFNHRAATDSVGKDQPPLTQGEVIAAVRWSLLDHNKLPVSDKTFQTLKSIADSGELPAGFELESVNGFQPNDTLEFTAWSVRLRIPAEPQGSTCVPIRELMINSRLIGDEERKVIHQWHRKGVPSSFETRRYTQERAKAAEVDRFQQR